MDRIEAQRLAATVFDRPDQGLSTWRVDPKALNLADTDHSGALSQTELTEALGADTVCLDQSQKALLPCQQLSLAAPAKPPETKTVVGDTAALTDALDQPLTSPKPTTQSVPSPAGTTPVAAPHTSPVVAPSPRAVALADQFATAPAQAPLRLSPENKVPPPSFLPAPRQREPMMLSAPVGHLPSASVNTNGVDMSAPITASGKFRLGVHMDTNPTQATQHSNMFLEESHPNYEQWRNVAHSGLTVGLDSHSRMDLNGSQIVATATGPVPGATSAQAMSMDGTIRHEERIHIDRSFAVFGKQPDTTVQAGYLVGVGPWHVGGATPNVLPAEVSQYATFNVSTHPVPKLGLTGDVYVPIQNGANAQGDHTITRLTAGIPHLTVGTTQTVDTGHYDVSTSWLLPRKVALSATAAIDDNRTTNLIGYSGGVQLNVPW